MVETRAFDRRRLLQAAGVSAGTLFLPSLLGDRTAYAGAPKRLVIFWTRHGPVTGRWEMRRPGLPAIPPIPGPTSGYAPSAEEWELPLDDPDPMSFSETLRPLHAVRKDLLVLEGLTYTSALAGSPYNNHVVALHAGLKGLGYPAKGPSVDQIVAEQVAVPGRIKYLFYTTGCCWASPPVADLAGNSVAVGAGVYLGQVYSRLFGGLAATAPGAGAAPPAPSGPELSRRRRGSVLGLVRNEYAALLPRLGAEDRAKLARHRDMIADLEKQVVSLSELKCEKPAAPPAKANGVEVANVLLSKFFPIAMACDLTRVAVLGHEQLETSDFGGPSGQDVHQDIAHPSKSGENAAHMTSYYKLHAQQFATLVAAFKAVPEGSGTMLDNSILLWLPELANGWHDYQKLMVVMAGGGGGAFRTGRYIKYAETGPDPSPKGGYGYIATGPGHNKLLVAIMQAMGVDRNAIGLERATGLRYQPGAPIDLTGALPRLKA